MSVASGHGTHDQTKLSSPLEDRERDRESERERERETERERVSRMATHNADQMPTADRPELKIGYR